MAMAPVLSSSSTLSLRSRPPSIRNSSSLPHPAYGGTVNFTPVTRLPRENPCSSPKLSLSCTRVTCPVFPPLGLGRRCGEISSRNPKLPLHPSSSSSSSSRSTFTVFSAAKGYKMKTHKASAKRFRVTGSGKIMRRKAGKQHLLAKKNTKRKLRLSKMVQVKRSDYDNVIGALPYLKVNRNVK